MFHEIDRVDLDSVELVREPLQFGGGCRHSLNLNLLLAVEEVLSLF